MMGFFYWWGKVCITVVAGGAKWFIMYSWWEIVVYYESSIQRELVWVSTATISTVVVGTQIGSNYRVC